MDLQKSEWENPEEGFYFSSGVNIESCVFKSRINFESKTMEIETENLAIQWVKYNISISVEIVD